MSESLIFGVRVDTTGVTQALSAFKNQIDDVSDGITKGFNAKLASSPVGKFMDKLKLATTSSNEFGKALGSSVVGGLQAAAVAAVAATTAVSVFTVSTARAANEIKKMSDATGVNVTTLSKFATMVSKGGGSVEDATDIMKDYADKLGDARKGNADLSETFKKLGVDITKNNSEAFAQTIEGLGKLKDKSVAMNIGMQLFSDNYTKIASQIANGNTLINQTPIMSDEFISKSETLMSSFNRLKTNMITFGTEAVVPIIEDLNTLIGVLMTPGLSGETPLETAMKKISGAIKNASANIAFVTGGKQATETNTSTPEETLANNKKSLEYQQNAVNSAKVAYDLAVKTSSSNIESARSMYEYSLKDLAALKKIVASNQKVIDDKAKATKDEETAQANLIKIQMTAEADKLKADQARAKAKADADAKEAKRVSDYNAAVNRAIETITSAQNELWASSHEGKLKLIEQDQNKQLEAIKIIGTETERYILAKANIESNTNRKIAEEKARYAEELKTKTEADTKKMMDDAKKINDIINNVGLASKSQSFSNLQDQMMKPVGITKYGDGESSFLKKGSKYLTEQIIVLDSMNEHIDATIENYNTLEDEINAIQPGKVPVSLTESLAGLKETIQLLYQTRDLQADNVSALNTSLDLGDRAIAEQLNKYGQMPETIWGRIFKVTDEDEEALNRGIEMIGQSLDAAMNMFSVISETKYNRELQSADRTKKMAQDELASKRMTDKQRLAEQKKIDDQYEADKKAAFQKTKGLKIAQVGMDAASSIMGAWSGAMQLPFPASVIAGGALTTMLGVTAGVQANNIRKQEYADGGVVGGFNGASLGRDNRVATIREGEMIMNAKQQRNLFKAIDKGELGGGGVTLNIENFTGGDDELSKLEGMLYRLQSNGRFRFA